MDVVHAIEHTKTGSQDRPVEPVVIAESGELELDLETDEEGNQADLSKVMSSSTSSATESESTSPISPPPQVPEDSSPLAWFLLLVIVFGIPLYAFIKLGGLRLIRRKLGFGSSRKEGPPMSQRDGYSRVDLEE
ncbi:hypothetical protein Clacol_000668 [Clathrus columnatus]|uniref:Uncharacterized protein n=1 Tax=Clathrus columnatus TaxID=1419009 RepID=A0AAV5A0C0_9AGAM|nr:hypothetical protein Clacol_000668 [Clathrus columnatus]